MGDVLDGLDLRAWVLACCVCRCWEGRWGAYCVHDGNGCVCVYVLSVCEGGRLGKMRSRGQMLDFRNVFLVMGGSGLIS